MVLQPWRADFRPFGPADAAAELESGVLSAEASNRTVPAGPVRGVSTGAGKLGKGPPTPGFRVGVPGAVRGLVLGGRSLTLLA